MVEVRRISLPEELDRQLKTLAELQQESNGVLLYTSQGLDFRVDHLYMTNIGTAGHVQADPIRMEIINKFFERHPEYQLIKWHTHSRGTGEYWFDKLSEGDIRSYNRQLEEDPEFIGMMVSPVKKIIVARGKGEESTLVRVVPTPHDFYDRRRRLETEIELAARELGYTFNERTAREVGYTHLPRLRATQKIGR